MLNRYLTKKAFLAVLASGAFLFCPSAVRGQAVNACDLNADGKVDMLDVQAATNMALGLAPCKANVTTAGVCDLVVVQRIVNAALSGNCVTGLPSAGHSATLSWTASTSTNVTGYNVYRSTQASGPYAKVNATPVAGTSYTDTAVTAGLTYYYVATAVDSSNNESVYSSQTTAVIPTP